MNRLTLIRFSESKEDTLGLLFWDGRFKCFTLEDEFRAVKVMGETRIPEGEYKLELREAGRLHKIFSDRWEWHQHGMIWLRAVPNFKWIYLHPGVNSGHTEGCILVANNATVNTVDPGGSVFRGMVFLKEAARGRVSKYSHGESWGLALLRT